MSNSKTIYLNLEDDVNKIMNQVQRENAAELVLVFPKKSFIFSDSINLRLLKKQIEPTGKLVSILTMDTKGQIFAKEAGFALKFLPKTMKSKSFSDIRTRKPAEKKAVILPSVEDLPPLENIPEPESIVEPVVLKKILKTTKTISKSIPISPKTSSTTSLPRRTPVGLTKTLANNDFLDSFPNHQETHQLKHKAQSKHVPKEEQAIEAKKASAVSMSDQNWYIPPSENSIVPHRRKSYSRILIGFVVVAIIITSLLVWVILPSASIRVKLKNQTISRDTDVLVNSGGSNIEANALTVAGSVVNETKTYSETLETVGKKEIGSKAQGRVIIYNLTGSPINLKSSTTVLTVGDKKYYFSADQTGIKNLNSATNDADASTADIIADGGGELFNLPSGTRLEITNQAFGSQPQRLYAKTITQVIGGSSRFTSVLSSEDVQAAKDSLEQLALADIEKALETKKMSLVAGSYTTTFNNFTMDKAEGDETPTFSASAEVVISGIAFDENNLKQVLRQKFSESLGTTSKLQEESKDTVVYKINSVDVANNTMLISIQYESVAVPQLDLNSLRIQLQGKSKNDAKEILDSSPDIEESQLNIFPSFLSKIPRISSKIEIIVE